ncbi:MAG TPA: replicative DNA helicase [Pilimelia sp.]|nr:replicative DNA helicase [Pilimelia sp.]
MSITDDARPEPRSPAGAAPGPPAGDGPFERTPPQDVAAEQCVLGGMLLSKDAIADVVEILRSGDFYRPVHATIFDAILDLYGRGEPADPITVAAALADSGDLARIGGAPYLHTLIASVPTAANAAYYARIVGERAVLRRLVEAGTRIVQLGYGSGGGAGRDVDDVVDLAQQAVYDVTERRVSEDFAVLADMLQPTLDEIEAVGAHGGVMTGIPTGFSDLDRLLNGLHPGQLVIVAGRPGLGKALALDTPLPTPRGWTTMGDVRVGDRLLGADGAPTTVVARSEIMLGRPCYAVEFSDGSVIVADAAHRWPTRHRPGAGPVRIRTTAQIRAALRAPALAAPALAAATGPCGAGGIGWAGAAGAVALAEPLRRAAGVAERSITAVRPVPSVPVRCVTVDNADHLYLAGRSMVPTHNSTAAMDFARSASVRHNLASAIFSLEMSKVEIVMRLLSAEAKVPLHVLRSGQLSDDDWTKLARRMGEISEAPLFVDDTPSMNLMEIRAKARRLKQRHDLKLVVVDYLQLMTSPKRTESRQQEVADLSRGLKLLAKEVECPVIAVSQLNRGPEQRTDKRPQLSDLRESGCLTADTTLLRADTGAPVSFGELLRDGHDGVLVWSLDERRRLVPAPVTAVFPSGVKPTYRLVLETGRTVKASGNHPFLTRAGWRRLDALAPGSAVAVPRRVPAPIGGGPGWSPRRLRLLAEALRSADGPSALPPSLYAATDGEVGAFLRHLWAGEAAPVVGRGVADGVLTLLARLGVVAAVEADRRDGAPGPAADRRGRGPGPTAYRIVLPPGAADRLRAGEPRPPGEDDVYWDRVAAVEPLGEQPVYDATVKGTHNFVADGVIAHNSIEQDADVVILLHRDDYYDKESPRAGEADFIVAKHRNGPTDTVTVAAQLHLSRFVDMAI